MSRGLWAVDIGLWALSNARFAKGIGQRLQLVLVLPLSLMHNDAVQRERGSVPKRNKVQYIHDVRRQEEHFGGFLCRIVLKMKVCSTMLDTLDYEF